MIRRGLALRLGVGFFLMRVEAAGSSGSLGGGCSVCFGGEEISSESVSESVNSFWTFLRVVFFDAATFFFSAVAFFFGAVTFFFGEATFFFGDATFAAPASGAASSSSSSDVVLRKSEEPSSSASAPPVGFVFFGFFFFGEFLRAIASCRFIAANSAC